MRAAQKRAEDDTEATRLLKTKALKPEKWVWTKERKVQCAAIVKRLFEKKVKQISTYNFENDPKFKFHFQVAQALNELHGTSLSIKVLKNYWYFERKKEHQVW